jgi:hypothetical protein
VPVRPLALALSLTIASAVIGGSLGTAQVFPPSNWWNLDISQAPVDTNSAAYITYIGTTRTLHPDFGPSPYGIPYVVVSADEPLVQPTWLLYGDESDNGAPGRPPGYPIPPEAQTLGDYIEGAVPGGGTKGDRHMLLVDKDNWLLYETGGTHWNATLNRWEANGGAVFDLKTNARRPDGWTSADAAGLAIFPGLVRWEEANGTGEITHAFRVTVRATNGYVWPASHKAGSSAGALPMGARLRLKSTKSLSSFTPDVQRIFRAMQRYGLIVADNGTDMYVTGTLDPRWNNDVLNPAFGSLSASDFDVVQLGWKGAPPTSPANLRIIR